MVVSIDKTDKSRIEPIKPQIKGEMASSGPDAWARYRVEIFSSGPTHRLISAEQFTALYTVCPLVDRFSDGSVLFVTQPSWAPGDPLFESNNALVFKNGIKVDEFFLSDHPSSVCIDAHDDIWMCPTELAMEGYFRFFSRDDDSVQDLGDLAPICFDRRGVIKRNRMPWTHDDRGRTEMCCVNRKDASTFIWFLKENHLGVIIGKNKDVVDWEIEIMVRDLYAFAFTERYILTYDFYHHLRLFDRESPRVSIFDFLVDGTFAPIHPMHFAVGRGDELHLWSHNQWLVFTVENARNQFSLWKAGRLS